MLGTVCNELWTYDWLQYNTEAYISSYRDTNQIVSSRAFQQDDVITLKFSGDNYSFTSSVEDRELSIKYCNTDFDRSIPCSFIYPIIVQHTAVWHHTQAEIQWHPCLTSTCRQGHVNWDYSDTAYQQRLYENTYGILPTHTRNIRTHKA